MSVACALHALEEQPPSLLSLEDILMGCFLNQTATGADPRWGLSALQRVTQGLAVSGRRSTRPSTGGMAWQPRSGGPPASTGGMARSPLWWPLCWHPSGTWVPSPSVAAEPPPRRPRPVPPSAGCS